MRAQKIHFDELMLKLKESGYKLRGIGYLVGLVGTEPLPIEPVEEVYEGLGILLDEIGRDLIESARGLDEWLASSQATSGDGFE